MVTSCRTLRSSTLQLVVIVRVRSVRVPPRGPVAAISGFGLRGMFPVWLGFDVTAHKKVRDVGCRAAPPSTGSEAAP